MKYSRFPNWDVDVEKGTVYRLKYEKQIGTIFNRYVKIRPPKGYKHWSLHQYIWMVANQCEIPEGYEVHHIDGNKLNNSISNLMLLTEEEHHRLHMDEQHLKEETRKKMSESKKGNTNMLGKKHTEETKKKISKTKSGTPSHKRKTVCQYTLDGELIREYISCCDTKKYGFNVGNVSACCRGVFNKNNTYKGFIWKYKN